MKPVHINIAESIFEPFWDPELSGLNDWVITNKNASTVLLEQTWSTAHFIFKENELTKYAFTMSNEYDNVLIADMDSIIISAALQIETIILVKINDGINILEKEFICEDGKKHEYEMDVSSIKSITKLSISIGSEKNVDGSGWFNWIGLFNKKLLNKHLESKNDFDENTWDKHLEPKDYKPKFIPTYGILLNTDEILSLRKRARKENEQNKKGSKILMGNLYKDDINFPEKYISDSINFLHDTRFNRKRDENKYLLQKGDKAVIAGIVYKDPKLLRLAARYALSIASCDNWDDSFMCNYKTSTFNHRCFVQSLCLYECALILDIAGEMFTNLGRDLILRKMAEEGIGSINFNTWKYEYIFHNNQMAWFSPGRMYGYAVLMQEYPRIEKYMDIALDDIIENLNNTIEEDGGYVEGPGYFSSIGKEALLTLYIYSRARGVDINELIPPIVSKTVDFIEIVKSSDDFIDFIPFCDSGFKVKPAYINQFKVHLSFMTYFFPESVWPDIYYKHLKLYGMGDNPIVWILNDKISKSNYKKKNFLKLPVTGHVSSYRKAKKGYSRIFVPGNKAGAGHTHADKGSFVFEYNGEMYLMDSGICNYDNPISLDMKFPDRHNMLIPYGTNEIPYPDNPLMNDIIPIAFGNDISFNAKLKLSPGWGKWYKNWERQINSPSPEEIIITDTYSLKQGEGVSMMLNSSLEISSLEKKAIISGKKGNLIIEIPDDCSMKIEKLPNPISPHNRLTIFKKGMEGILNIKMHMVLK
ncbi:MAG: heparinase II/III family protein [Clostridiales bacterium]|nr:heparinase II/III family protein [Clostridiales bacterium]